MRKITLLSIAVLASRAGAAIAQAAEPEPAWRESALALAARAVLQPGDELQLVLPAYRPLTAACAHTR
jgi:hypothetical protein